MATDISNNPEVVPYYRRPADRRTTIVPFRIYRDQKDNLEANYEGRSSELVRFLLDKYFKNELPEVVKEFHAIKG